MNGPTLALEFAAATAAALHVKQSDINCVWLEREMANERISSNKFVICQTEEPRTPEVAAQRHESEEVVSSVGRLSRDRT